VPLLPGLLLAFPNALGDRILLYQLVHVRDFVFDMGVVCFQFGELLAVQFLVLRENVDGLLHLILMLLFALARNGCRPAIFDKFALAAHFTPLLAGEFAAVSDLLNERVELFSVALKELFPRHGDESGRFLGGWCFPCGA